MQVPFRQVFLAVGVVGALTVTSGCGSEGGGGKSSTADSVTVSKTPQTSGSPSTSASAGPSGSPSSSASPSASGSAEVGKGGEDTAHDAKAGGSAGESTAGSRSGSSGSGSTVAPKAPDFPVPVTVGNATQLITVDSSGSHATVTAWTKETSGWKAQFSTASGRVGSNGVTNGSTRHQGTWTTPTGTYTITEGFGVESANTAMPYHVVNSDDWWVEDPESKYYNDMHGEAGADFPLTQSGERGSEHLINYPAQYAEALVINFNRWPAVPGRGAGIFLHVNGSGATAGCVSVPRATMDRFMSWIKPSHHPRIAIG